MKFFLSILLSVFLFQTFSQRIINSDFKVLKQKEDTLKHLAYQIMEGKSPAICMLADSQFTRLLVSALKIKNSFYYPFDSLSNISKLTPADSSFKIFTWQLVVDENQVRHHGAIQMKTNDGSLKLYPLVDRTGVTENVQDTIGNNFGWIGAVYYKVIETEEFGKKFYTLLGYDENNIRSNKKIIEVLTFPNNEPVFGGPYFSYQDNSINKKFPHRFIMEYKKHAGPRLTFDNDQNMIIYEHLVSPSGEPSKKYTLVGDGDYEGLKWMQGKWVHINKVFTFKLEDGQAPVPSPLKADHGTIDNTKPLDDENTEINVAPQSTTTKKKSKPLKKIKNQER